MVLAGVWGSAPKSAAATDIVLDPPLDQFDDNDGSVVGWGYNGNGQINIPQSAQSGVTAIAAGSVHSLALKSDGSVVGWGYNDYGQINTPQGLSLWW